MKPLLHRASREPKQEHGGELKAPARDLGVRGCGSLARCAGVGDCATFGDAVDAARDRSNLRL